MNEKEIILDAMRKAGEPLKWIFPHKKQAGNMSALFAAMFMIPPSMTVLLLKIFRIAGAVQDASAKKRSLKHNYDKIIQKSRLAHGV